MGSRNRFGPSIGTQIPDIWNQHLPDGTHFQSWDPIPPQHLFRYDRCFVAVELHPIAACTTPAIRHIHERHPCRCRLHGLCHDKVGSVFGPHEVDGGHVRGEDDAHDALHALVTPARVLPHWFFLNIAARKRLLVLGMLRSLSGTSIKSSAVRWRPRRSSRQPMHKAPPMVSMPAAFHHCHVPYAIRQAGQRSSDSQRNWLPPLPANIADTVQRSRHCDQSCGAPPAAARPTASGSIPYCGNASGGSTGKTRT